MKNIERINWEIKLHLDFETDEVSDWYHTFWGLYKHRIHLFIALCSVLSIWAYPIENYVVIRSKKHNDWSEIEWYFILQVHNNEARVPHKKIDWTQISYYLPNKYWDECNFAGTKEKADKWDWHTSDDVLDRLLKI